MHDGSGPGVAASGVQESRNDGREVLTSRPSDERRSVLVPADKTGPVPALEMPPDRETW